MCHDGKSMLFFLTLHLHMKRFILCAFMVMAWGVAVHAETDDADTLRAGTDTLHTIVVTGDGRLPISVDKERLSVPRTKGLSDLLGEKANDKIMHPLAVKQRKKERRQSRMLKALDDYDKIQVPNEQLREALEREGLLEQLEANRPAEAQQSGE